jgi:hypothetical protein
MFVPGYRLFGPLPLKKTHDFGQETVKFWMLYQPLTSIGPAPGKEKENQAGREIGCPPPTDTQDYRVGKLAVLFSCVSCVSWLSNPLCPTIISSFV